MEGDDKTSKADKMPDDHHTTSTHCPANLLTTYNEVAADTTDKEDEVNKDNIDNLVAENSASDKEVEEIKGVDNLVVENSVSDEEIKNVDNLVVEDSVSESGSDDIGYTPSDFEVVLQEPLLDIEVDDDIELWLMQLPPDQTLDDFEGQTVSFDLDIEDGPVGSIKTKSGKVYSMVNFPAPVADVTVFIPGLSGTKVAGKISRHVNLVCFPEPDELILQCEEKATLESDSGETRSNSSSDLEFRLLGGQSKNKKGKGSITKP